MIIKETGWYDNKKKNFIVIKYCCDEMEREVSECDEWELDEDNDIGFFNDGLMFCGKYCSHCGEKITIQ